MKTSHQTCDLNTCFLCKLSLKEWLPAIGVHKQNFEIKKGQHIFKEGDPVRGIYFIYKGSVKVHKRWDDEKELIIRFARQGDILGHLGLGNDVVYPITTTALEPTVVCYLDMAFFESTLKINQEFTYKLLRFFANELQESEKRMRNLAHMSVKARIAQALVTLKKQFGLHQNGYVNTELTRQEIASFAGTTYETLFKVINEFVSDEIILMEGKHIFIRNEEKLNEVIKKDNIKN